MRGKRQALPPQYVKIRHAYKKQINGFVLICGYPMNECIMCVLIDLSQTFDIPTSLFQPLFRRPNGKNQKLLVHYYGKSGPVGGLLFLRSMLLTVDKCSCILIANDWSQMLVLWCQKSTTLTTLPQPMPQYDTITYCKTILVQLTASWNITTHWIQR